MNFQLIRFFRLFSLTGISLLTFSDLRAQTGVPYSLGHLIDAAKRNLPLLLQQQDLVNSAAAGVTEARNIFLPKLNVGAELSIGSSNDVEGSYLPLEGVVRATSGSIRSANTFQPQSGNIASVLLEYDLVNFGLRDATIKNASAFSSLQQAGFNKEVYVISLQIGKLYFDILKNKQQLAVDGENISRYRSIAHLIGALTSSGIKAGVDSSLALAELSKIRVNYNRRQGLVAQLKQELSFLSGIDTSKLVIDTLRSDELNRAKAQFSLMTDSLSNPLVDYYVREKALYQSVENLTRKSYLPKIVLAGGGWGRGSSIAFNDNYQPLGLGLGYQRFNYVGAIGMSYNLMDIVHRRDEVAVKHFQTKAAEESLNQQRLALKNAVDQASIEVFTAEKDLHELPLQLQAATDVYNQKIAQYKAGVINLIDLTNAAYILYSAQLNYLQTVEDWYLAYLDKSASTGNLNLFIQSIRR